MDSFITYINLTVIFVFILIVIATLVNRKEEIPLKFSFSFPFLIVIITCVANLIVLHYQLHRWLFLQPVIFIFTLFYGPSLMYYVYHLVHQKLPYFFNIVYFTALIPLFFVVRDLFSSEETLKMALVEIRNGVNMEYNLCNLIILGNTIFFCIQVKRKIKRLQKQNSNSDYLYTKKIKWASDFINYMILSVVVFLVLVLVTSIFYVYPIIYNDLIVMPLFMLTIYSFIVIKNSMYQKESELEYKMVLIENQNQLQNQRLKISRDLHDNIGSQLTFIISSLDNLKYKLEENPKEKIENSVTTISSFAKNAIAELRDTIWVMNSEVISWEDLESRIHNYIEKAKFAMNSVSFSIAIENSIKEIDMPSSQGMHIYRIIQEAINNAMKHSEATIIAVNIKKVFSKIKITIQDNGKGFDASAIVEGNGIYNMKQRTVELQANFVMVSSDDGTRIEIEI